ncbi:MAG: ATP-binding cassette domain-containing protein [Myxococcota bacterium]|nr:ATP-binding cassette domain-containing protein [Myxococcota bacterium]
MISIKDLSKQYGAVKAVDQVSFEVGRGEIVGLLGHNGAGKTTLMKMITGYLEPTQGSASIGGVDVVENRLGVQQQIGYMPENAPLYEEMAVQEYLCTMADYRGIPKDRHGARVLAAATATGLTTWLTSPIATLSKGYRQRVGLAQAILHKPDVLILDEPTNGLDPTQIVEIRGLIKALAQDSTVILSTHILPEIEAVCDRVIILIDGVITKDAALKDLLAADTVILSIPEDAQGAADKLRTLESVTTARMLGADPQRPGFTILSLQYQGDTPPIPEIAALANETGWQIGRIAEERPRLEQVFGELMDAHVQRSNAGKAKEVAA